MSASPSPPGAIRIGYATYRVEHDRQRCDDDSVEGMSNGNQRLILLRGDRPYDSAADTVLHEVLHQCLHVAGLDAGVLTGEDVTAHDVEERVVRAMSGMLLDTLRENPELVRYLLHNSPTAQALAKMNGAAR